MSTYLFRDFYVYLFVFICIFICISVISIRLKNISVWVFFCKLAAYIQNSFIEKFFWALWELSGILFLDILIILILLFITLHMRITSYWKSKETLSEEVLRCSSKNLFLKSYSKFIVISEKVAWQIVLEFWTILCGR